MPIQFRCTSCQQKLAISRRKAGKVVKCPACAADLQVPTLDAAEATGALVEPPPRTSTPPQESAPPSEPPATEPNAEEAFFDDIAPGVFDDLDEPVDEPETEAAPAATQPESPEAAPPQPPAEHTSPPSEEPFTEPAPPVGKGAADTSRRWADEEGEEDDEFHLARQPIDEGGLDMTPMVDVTFLLLIFFMITASFSIQKSMESEAPEPEEEGAAQMPTMDDLASDSVIVEIDENDVIYVDDTQVASVADVISELELKIANESKREMIIQPHPLAKHGTVVQVTDAGIEVGMQRIRRVTRGSE